MITKQALVIALATLLHSTAYGAAIADATLVLSEEAKLSLEEKRKAVEAATADLTTVEDARSEKPSSDLDLKRELAAREARRKIDEYQEAIKAEADKIESAR